MNKAKKTKTQLFSGSSGSSIYPVLGPGCDDWLLEVCSSSWVPGYSLGAARRPDLLLGGIKLRSGRYVDDISSAKVSSSAKVAAAAVPVPVVDASFLSPRCALCAALAQNPLMQTGTNHGKWVSIVKAHPDTDLLFEV